MVEWQPARGVVRPGAVVVAAVVTVVASVVLALVGYPAGAAQRADRADGVNATFAAAAAESGVPRDLLVTMGYAETRLDSHDGQPSASNGYGVMHLVSNPKAHTLEEAAKLTSEPADTLKRDTAANIRGAAAVLRSYADDMKLDDAARRDPGRWYEVVARFAHASNDRTTRLYADYVYELLGKGVTATVAGERVTVAAQPVRADRGRYERVPELGDDVGAHSDDYPPAHWVPAHSGNQTASNRPTSYPINFVVIHVTQGSYAGSISWFQNPSSQVSAHYVIRSSDGDVTQMVRHKDIGWHAGNWDYNTRSIGIEHEGWVDDPSWFTESMYRASADLTKFLCDTYGIPKTRDAIIGHNEVPGADHTDPGPHWDWDHYMELVTGDGGGGEPFEATVDNAEGGFAASGNWATGTAAEGKNGADYRTAEPVLASDPAWYTVAVPAAGRYRVEVWYPAASGHNNATPYIVATSGGNQTVYVDQRTGGGAWRDIGTFSLAAGERPVVGVSRWTSGTGTVVADAVRISR